MHMESVVGISEDMSKICTPAILGQIVRVPWNLQIFRLALDHVWGMKFRFDSLRICDMYIFMYRHTYYIRRTLVGNKLVDHSDVVGASPVDVVPTTSSFST